MSDHEYGDKFLKISQRVELHPGTDWWMRGARYGEIAGRIFIKAKDNEPFDVVYRVKLDNLIVVARINAKHVRAI